MIVLLVSGLLLQACYVGSTNVVRGDGQVLAKTHRLENFRHIDIQGMFDIQVSRGDDTSVVLETDENLHELTSIEVRDNTLFIWTEKDVVIRPTKMELKITFAQLDEIHIGGACKLHAAETLIADRLQLQVSGAADIDLDLNVTDLITSISGAANIQLAGIASSHHISLSGASNMRAESLRTEQTNIRVSGAGSAHVFATEKLHASLSGVGNIRYYGNPRQVTTDKSGLGSIRSAN